MRAKKLGSSGSGGHRPIARLLSRPAWGHYTWIPRSPNRSQRLAAAECRLVMAEGFAQVREKPRPEVAVPGPPARSSVAPQGQLRDAWARGGLCRTSSPWCLCPFIPKDSVWSDWDTGTKV